MSRSLLPSLIVVASLLAAPSAMAQTIRGMSVSDHDMRYVEAWCSTLARKEIGRDSAPGGMPRLLDNGEEDPNSVFSNQPPESWEALTTIDLGAIRYSDCQKAGLG